jgi:hypothetical protein
MSQIPTEHDDNGSVAASDFVQLDQPDEVPDQQQEAPHNYDHDMKEQKLMMANLEVFLGEE